MRHGSAACEAFHDRVESSLRVHAPEMVSALNAQQAMLEDKTLTFEDRSYGAIDLASPVKSKNKNIDNAIEDKSGGGSKSSAKVAPA